MAPKISVLMGIYNCADTLPEAIESILNQTEQEALETVCAVFRNQGLIPCTACRYCTEVCPQEIPIPELFSAVNAKRSDQPYTGIDMDSQCIKCGRCEEVCPQNLKIRELLTVAAEEL